MTGLNSVDIAFLSVYVVSILAGFMRGFVREMISLATWIAAFIVAILFSARLAAVFTSSAFVAKAAATLGGQAATPVSFLAIGISFVILFIATLLVGSFINYLISSFTSPQNMSFNNRFLGGLFGFARGLLIVLIIIFLAQLSPLGSRLAWAQSIFVQCYRPVILWMNEQVEPHLAVLKNKLDSTLKNVDTNAYFQQFESSHPES